MLREANTIRTLPPGTFAASWLCQACWVSQVAAARTLYHLQSVLRLADVTLRHLGGENESLLPAPSLLAYTGRADVMPRHYAWILFAHTLRMIRLGARAASEGDGLFLVQLALRASPSQELLLFTGEIC